jgi:hypothetical protein
MRDRAAQDSGKPLAGPFDIVDELALAAQEAKILRAKGRATNEAVGISHGPAWGL